MSETLHPERLARSRILVRVPNWVGDTVMCLPALRALRAALPQAELVLLARPWVRDVLCAAEPQLTILPYDTFGEHRGAR